MPAQETVFYFDTSALAKLYLKERGSRRLASWAGPRVRGFTPAIRIFVSRVVFPETMSAITRRRSDRMISATAAQRLWNDVVSDFLRTQPPYEVLEISEAIVYRAALLVAEYGLRAYDAVHLASALTLQMELDPAQALHFVCADRRLIEVARAERLTTVNPENSRVRVRSPQS
jgi:predicted nucleic acid-binding protein